jgi:hypothetical protein
MISIAFSRAEVAEPPRHARRMRATNDSALTEGG